MICLARSPKINMSADIGLNMCKDDWVFNFRKIANKPQKANKRSSGISIVCSGTTFTIPLFGK